MRSVGEVHFPVSSSSSSSRVLPAAFRARAWHPIQTLPIHLHEGEQCTSEEEEEGLIQICIRQVFLHICACRISNSQLGIKVCFSLIVHITSPAAAYLILCSHSDLHAMVTAKLSLKRLLGKPPLSTLVGEPMVLQIPCGTGTDGKPHEELKERWPTKRSPPCSIPPDLCRIYSIGSVT